MGMSLRCFCLIVAGKSLPVFYSLMPNSCVALSHSHDLWLSLAFNPSRKEFFFFSTFPSHAIFLSLYPVTAFYLYPVFLIFLSESSYLFFLKIIPVYFLSTPLLQTTKCYISLYFNCLPNSAIVVNARNQTSPTTINIWLALADLHNCTYEYVRYCGVLNRGPHYWCVCTQLTISSRSGIMFVACMQMRLFTPTVTLASWGAVDNA